MTRRPLRLAGHRLVVSRRVAWARASRRARVMVRRLEAVVGHALPQWQRDVLVQHFTLEEMKIPDRVYLVA